MRLMLPLLIIRMARTSAFNMILNKLFDISSLVLFTYMKIVTKLTIV